MKRLFLATIPTVVALLVLWGGTPIGFDQSLAAGRPDIRADGTVEILRPDGAVAATLVVEIVETAEDRARGLMGRVLADHLAGMLFIFESAQPQSFWMRNTPSSLDMIFIDAAGRILNIAAYTVPMSDQLYSSNGRAKYVVEAKAGFADRFGIRPGHTVRWKRVR